MSLLFLDIDGVLNDHRKLASGYCGIQPAQVAHLNTILDAVPDCRLVISSAWRYCVLNGWMTLKGFEYLLLVHGIKCDKRVAGVTEADPLVFVPDLLNREEWNRTGLRWRARQIEAYLDEGSDGNFAVLDDLPLDVPCLVQTDGSVGLTADDAAKVIALLSP